MTTIAELQGEISNLRRELDVAKSFHSLAVRERDVERTLRQTERHEANLRQISLMKEIDRLNELTPKPKAKSTSWFRPKVVIKRN